MNNNQSRRSFIQKTMVAGAGLTLVNPFTNPSNLTSYNVIEFIVEIIMATYAEERSSTTQFELGELFYKGNQGSRETDAADPAGTSLRMTQTIRPLQAVSRC